MLDTQTIAETKPSGSAIFLKDMVDGFKMHEVWLSFAWDETLSRYHRSALGVLWIILGYAVFVLGVSFFFGSFARMGVGPFTIYVALGYATFLFLIANVIDGCMVFSGSKSWIKSSTLPYSVYVYKSLFRALFPFAMQMTVAAAAIIYWQIPINLTAFLVAPALVLFILNGIAIQYLVGLLAARFRDISHLVNTVSRILIFTTPILWVREERGGIIRLVADFNPLTHYIEIFRAPLMGAPTRPLSWCVVLGLTVLVWLMAAVAAARMRQRLPFWV